jgi:hypothetical protein
MPAKTMPAKRTKRVLMPRRYARPLFYQYWSNLSPEQKQHLADTSATRLTYLSAIANGHRRPGIDLIQRLMLADKRLTIGVLRGAP